MTRVFVHLDHGLGEASWAAKAASGLVPDRTPYGYHAAGSGGVSVELSDDAPEGPLASLARRALTRLLGFDLLHAWHNRAGIRSADWVWTHTEKGHLAAAAVLAASPGPRLLAQTLWLFEQWPQLAPWKRALYRRLLRRADVHTFHTEANAAIAAGLGVAPTAVVRFGVAESSFPIVDPPDAVHRPVRVFAAGNDRHRDWPVLHRAARQLGAAVTVRIASSNASALPSPALPNVRVLRHASLGTVLDAYAWSDVVVVPVVANAHASGLTVTLEATRSGRPVIATDTIGLREYFDPDEVTFVPPGDPWAIAAALGELARDPTPWFDKVRAAQRRAVADDYTSACFARRHLELARSLDSLAGRTNP